MREEHGETILDEASGLTEPGPAALWSLVGRGWLLPLVILFYSGRCWLTQTAYLPGSASNSGIELYGLAARWMAVALFGLALFCNARWWWGARGYWQTQQVVMILACLIFLSGFFCAVVCGLGGV